MPYEWLYIMSLPLKNTIWNKEKQFQKPDQHHLSQVMKVNISGGQSY